MLEDGSGIPATEFELWDEKVEEVLPRQKYFGRNKQFSLDNMAVRLTLALAKLLQNMGKDPNTFALNIPEDYTENDWEELKDVIKAPKTVKTIKSKPRKRKLINIKKEIELKQVYLKKSKI